MALLDTDYSLDNISTPPMDKDGFLAASMTPKSVVMADQSFSGDLGEVMIVNSDDADFAAEDALNASLSATRSIQFPADVGKPHIPDYITFYFLDIITKDGSWINTNYLGDSYRTLNDTFDEDASKQTKTALAGRDHLLTKAAIPIQQGVTAMAELRNKLPGDEVNAAVVGAHASQAYTDALGIGDTYKRTGDVAHLLMPSSIQFNTGAGWQAVTATPTGVGLLAEVALSANKLDSLKGAAGFGLAGLISSTLYEQGQAAMQSVAKKVYNPYVSQAFESMQRRQFQFSWDLFPKNQIELDMIHEIIKMFRYHMHPSLNADNMFLRYPSQLEMSFKIGGGDESLYLPKISTCVIKDFQVNYTPNNQWSTVNDDYGFGGAASQYQISLTVEEIVPLVKQDIQKGF